MAKNNNRVSANLKNKTLNIRRMKEDSDSNFDSDEVESIKSESESSINNQLIINKDQSNRRLRQNKNKSDTSDTPILIDRSNNRSQNNNTYIYNNQKAKEFINNINSNFNIVDIDDDKDSNLVKNLKENMNYIFNTDNNMKRKRDDTIINNATKSTKNIITSDSTK